MYKLLSLNVMRAFSAAAGWIYKRLHAAFTQLISLHDDPRRIAGGFAIGSFFGVTPFIGMQIILAVLTSGFLKRNKLAATIGVINTNWVKGLFIYPLNYKLGAWITGYNQHFPMDFQSGKQVLVQAMHAGPGIFLCLVAGGLITGSLLAIIYYFLILHLVRKLQMKRKDSHNLDDLYTMKNTNQPYALVTGASQGLGKAICEELASSKKNLLLVSLAGEGLPVMACRLMIQYGIDVRYHETDLCKEESVYELADWASEYPVSILINNAGTGGTMAFESASARYIDAIIQLNIRATTLLTRLMLPVIRKQQRGFILNVASMAAFSPIAFKTVYPASKTFVWSFTRGLSEELRGTNISASVLHPGPMKTNADVSSRIEKQGFVAQVGLLSPERTARIAIRQLFRRDSLIIPGFLNKVNWLLMRIIPIWIRLPIVSRLVKREIDRKMLYQHAA
jgi:hypothetical protein